MRWQAYIRVCKNMSPGHHKTVVEVKFVSISYALLHALYRDLLHCASNVRVIRMRHTSRSFGQELMLKILLCVHINVLLQDAQSHHLCTVVATATAMRKVKAYEHLGKAACLPDPATFADQEYFFCLQACLIAQCRLSTKLA